MPRRSTKAERVAWIVAHPDLWQGLPAYDQAPGAGREDQKTTIVRAMQRDGLISPSTNPIDVDVAGLIRQARMMRREKAAGLAKETRG